MTPEQLKEISRICPRWRDRPLAEIVAAVERVQAEPAAIAAHEAQQPSTDLPTFAHGVAARKWASLQADGFRMQSLKFERADGKTGEINPWGVVTWDVVGAPPQPMVQAAPEGKWDGAEDWMPLAWKLCADENGEEACTELVWEGGPVPEPWGDRWLKYEDEAKRLIALVRKYAAPQPTVSGGA